MPLSVWTGTAGRDESRYAEPGNWPHICLGIHLARMELRVGVNAVLDSLPGLRLDPAAPHPVIEGQVLRGPSSLHVLFDLAA